MTPSFISSLFFSVVVILLISSQVSGHGRLIDPPSRSSMWRYGFKTEPNYNDNELFCGGYTTQWQRNGGKCGVCGDAWDSPSPRPNEAGGLYGKGIITRQYKPGQVITSTVELTANHLGFFEFRLCPHNNPSKVVTQDCLDRYILQLADGSGTKYYPARRNGKFDIQLKLPKVSCSQCVFQWIYTAGNNWGTCNSETSKIGCGAQETFRGCADVAIGDMKTNDIPTFPSRRSNVQPRYIPQQTTRPTRPFSPLSYNNRPVDRPSITAIPRESARLQI